MPETQEQTGSDETAGAGQPSITRRVALAAAVGSVAALAAEAVGMARPEPASAWDGDSLMMGRIATGPHSAGVDVWTHDTGFKGSSAGGDGLSGVSNGDAKSGIYGVTLHRRGYGVFGRHITSHATGALATSVDGVQGWVDKADAAGVRGTAELAASAGVVGQNTEARTSGTLGGAAGVLARADESASDADALSVQGPLRLSRSGLIGIPAGASSGSKAVPHLHRWTSVIATLQTTNAGAQVASAAIDVEMAHVVVHLTGPVQYGVTVAFLLIESTP